MKEKLPEKITQIGEKVKRELEKSGITKWDIFLVDEQVFGVYFYNSSISNCLEKEFKTHTRNSDIYIRIFDDKKDTSEPDKKKMGIGWVHINEPYTNFIQNAIKTAKSIAKLNTVPHYDLVSPGLSYENPKTFDEKVWKDPHYFLNDKGDYLQGRLQENIGITTTFGKFRTYKAKKMLINSNNFSRVKKSTYFCHEFSFKAENENNIREYWPLGFIKSARDLKFDDYISEWSARTRDTLKAKKPNIGGNIDIILPANLIKSLLLPTLGFAVSGAAHYNIFSPFYKKEKIASELLTLMDDGLIEGCMSTSSWDSEGYPKKKTIVVENGILKNFLYDQKYASLMGAKSTGNAQRKINAGGTIQIEFNNLVIEPGKIPLKDIIFEYKHGRTALYINDFQWVNPDPITGEFSGEIKHGYVVKDGGLGEPIRGGTIVGNVFNMIKNIGAISSETRVFSNVKCPYILFKDMKVV